MQATKPEEWNENEPEYIPDETATRPTSWLEDEKEMIPDPSYSSPPEDWDEEEDGIWEAPLIVNPKCGAGS